MSTDKKRKQRSSSLAKGRPPTLQKPKPSLSAKATRTLIRSHHRLHKALADAERDSDAEKATQLRQQIEDRGGLQSYQQASIQGQSNDRGGDTSKVLLQWLPSQASANDGTIRMLEVGALSVNNACSRSGIFDVARIDLNSQADGIQQQDFMERPVPVRDTEKFDIISLSLVLNYVPTAAGRGKMLEHLCRFLQAQANSAELKVLDDFFPSVFLVLPAPCVTNSRYLNEAQLEAIMTSLGFVLVKRKLSNKLVYYLWKLHLEIQPKRQVFDKREVNPGKSRNNFCITLG